MPVINLLFPFDSLLEVNVGLNSLLEAAGNSLPRLDRETDYSISLIQSVLVIHLL